jgi:hypothetical protein
MRHLSRILCCIAVVLAATAGCGGSATGPPGQSRPPTASQPPAQSQPAVFPLTVRRTGGIAGFQDVLVVTGDGLVSVTRRAQKAHPCQLSPVALDRLRKAASLVPWSRITPASRQPSFPDEMVTTVESPAGGPVRVEDPLAGQAGEIFLDLLNDASGGPASRTCTPV